MQTLMGVDITDFLFVSIIFVAAAIGMSNVYLPYMVAFLVGCALSLSWATHKRLQNV